jgi:hypothetical protein
MQPAGHGIGRAAQRRQIAALQKLQAFGRRQAFTGDTLVQNVGYLRVQRSVP